MTAVLVVLSLLVFAAGLVAWAVHMHGVWTREADWAAPRRSARDPAPAPTAGTASDAEADNPLPPIAESLASTDEAVIKEARP